MLCVWEGQGKGWTLGFIYSKCIGILLLCQVDGDIVTIELPEATQKQWKDKEDFQLFHEDFVSKHPTLETFKAQHSKTSKQKEGGVAVTVTPPRKRPLGPDLSGCLAGLEKLPEADEIICEVAIVNFRASGKLTTVPTLVVSKKAGVYIKNDTGFEDPSAR